MDANEEYQKLVGRHASTYDALADEYEKRTDSLTAVTREAVDWMSQYLRPKGDVLDIGCGVGLETLLFVEKGFRVTCIDISPKMIAFAKKRNLNANFLQGDFLTTDFGMKFDGVFAFTFIHLFPKDIALRILAKIKGLLNADGVAYISSTRSEESKEGWEIKKDYSGQYERYRKHWTEAELKSALADADFKIIDSKIYADPFSKTWMDFIVKI